MILRPATIHDADLLLEWRNDQTTRMACRNQDPVKEDEHIEWLSNSLASNRREIYIAEIDHLPVATVRIDQRENGDAELSWTVSPHTRGQGIGKSVVRKVIDLAAGVSRSGRIVAYIRNDNVASQRIAKAVGFALTQTTDADDLERFEMEC